MRSAMIIILLVMLIFSTAGIASAAREPQNAPPPTASCVGALTSASDNNGEEVRMAVQIFNSKGVPFGLWIEYVAGQSGTLEACQQIARAALFCVVMAPTTDDALACLES